MNVRKRYLLGLWLIIPGIIFAGDSTEKPDNRFRLQSSERFLKEKPAADFEVAMAEAFEDTDRGAFSYSVMRFELPESPGKAFSHYTKANPLQVWKNSRSRIHAVYMPSSGRVLTPKTMTENWGGFEVGMKLFIDMSALPIAVINKPAMMIGVEIVEIDPVKRVIVLAYLEGTPSYGFQRMHFIEAPERGGTVIVHESWFQSYKKPVEKLYPYYHRKMLKSMHRRFRKSLEAANRSAR